MLENKSPLYLSSSIILFISIIFALLVGSGLYGFGIDFWSSYYKHNLDWGGIFDRFGYRIATLSIYGTHIGIYVTTLILSLSVGYFIREHLKSKSNYSFFLFLFLYLIAIHTWPIIMSTSNAMRQGMVMSLIFLALISSKNKNYIWLIIFCVISIFLHKSGLILSAIVALATTTNNIFKVLNLNNRWLLHFFIGIISLSLFYFFIPIFLDLDGPTKIIEGDFRAAFVLISFAYVILSLFYKNLITGPINLSLFYYSFISLPILLHELNWEYERLGMMMLIPYILSFGAIFDRPSNKIYLVTIFLALFFLTIYMGMYKLGLTNWEEYCASVLNQKHHCTDGSYFS
jgi:hypothetical protein